MKTTVEFLKGVSEYFAQVDKRKRCEKHRVLHTGRLSYGIIINCVLFEKTKENLFLNRAKELVDLVLSEVKPNKNGPGHIFWPGSCDPKNASMTVIDVGCCLDALATYYACTRDMGDEKELEHIRDTCLLVMNSYVLESGVLRKKINQRLWCLSGFAKAHKLFSWTNKQHRSFIETVLDASLQEIQEDGSIPYESDAKKMGKIHSSGDISPYYHSRHLAFLIQVYDILKKEIPEIIVTSTHFLCALYRPSGIKEMMLETKKWYWMSSYEIASNSFDCYVLAKMYAITKNPLFGYYLEKSYERLSEHQLADGSINASVEKKDNWQCPLFWSSHTTWIAKSFDDIELGIRDKHAHVPVTRLFKDAGLLRIEHSEQCVLIRTTSDVFNYDWGVVLGGGTWVYCSSKQRSWANTLDVSHLQMTTAYNLRVNGKRKKENKHIVNMMRGNIWRCRVGVSSGRIFSSLFDRLVFPAVFTLKDFFTKPSTSFLEFTVDSYTEQRAVLKHKGSGCVKEYKLQNGECILEIDLKGKKRTYKA